MLLYFIVSLFQIKGTKLLKTIIFCVFHLKLSIFYSYQAIKTFCIYMKAIKNNNNDFPIIQLEFEFKLGANV